MQPILSILIPSVTGRESQLKRLMSYIDWQLSFIDGSPVQVITEVDNKEMTIGAKRNLLLSKAKGIYSWMIDDDDWLSDTAIQEILDAATDGADCIGFKELCIMDNKTIKTSDFSRKYARWNANAKKQTGFDHLRSPFCKTPIKTEIAKKVAYQDVRYQEDEIYSNAILKHIRTETYIDSFIYIYRYKYELHNQKYGYSS